MISEWSIRKFLTVILSAFVLFCSCGKGEDNSETDTLLGEIEITLYLGDKIALSERFEPYNIYDGYNTVVWFTANPDIVTVSNNGDITAVGVGKTDIFIIATVSAKIGICHVTVLESRLNGLQP